MRVPRVRFTVRRMIVVVVVTAVLMDAARTGWHFWYCWNMAKAAADLRAMGPWRCGMVESTPEQERSFAEYCAKHAEHYSRLVAKYHRAAWRPWEAIPPDARHPGLSGL